jgi:ATP-dependent RNA helicase DDX47/RRP3
MSGKVKTLTDVERAAAIKEFESLGLCTQLAEAAAALNWKEPSNIQREAVPHLLQGKERALFVYVCGW